MGLITSTGLFKYIPPNPKITSTSSPVGMLGQVVSIYGEDLDYVDNLFFAGEKINFALVNGTQKMEFIVPSDPNTGKLVISSDSFEITGQNNLPFLPIFTIQDFDPKNGSEGSIINLSGKVLTSIVSGYILATPILDDINYYFSGEKNTFNIPMSTKTGVGDINLVQNINLRAEIEDYKLLNINDFNYSSGKSIQIKYDIPGNLLQKYYENHLLSMSSGVLNDEFQAFTTPLQSGYLNYTIDLPRKLNNTDYAIFYNIVQSGADHDDSYISNKTTGSFDLTIENAFGYATNLNVLLINSSGFIFDSGFFKRSYVDIDPNYSSQTIYFDPINRVDNNLYPPFLFTSIEKINNVDIGTTFSATNIYNLQKNSFDIAIPNAANNKSFRLNYFTIDNTGTDLSTFIYNGKNSYYKKIYLLTGNANTFQERLPLEDVIIKDKNSMSFKIPNSEYYINGNVILINQTGISKTSISAFSETPMPLAVLPNSGYRGSNIMIQGKSFKKPILIDSPYQYDSCFVKFRYSDNIYQENKSTFQTSFRIINKNLLSGYIPLSNIPTGRYTIQMMTEDGGLFE